jgi:putative copper resistance protein D
VDELIVIARAVHFAAVALLFGAPLFRLVISPHGSERGAPAGVMIELVAALAALLSAIGWFIGVVATMAGAWSDVLAPDVLKAVGSDTHFGRLWIARLTLMAAIVVLHVAAKPSRAKDIALLILAGAVTASLVGVGHGLAGSDALGPIHAVADMVHLLCAATWIGTLFCLALVLRRAVVGRFDAEFLHVVVPRFSRVGYVAVTLLLISGCVNALVLLPRPDALLTTAYGRVLLVKVGFALLMVAFAVYNRVVLVPRLIPSKGGAATLWLSTMVEQGIGLAVLATVALLGTIHPVP